jgi:hypothetical protein
LGGKKTRNSFFRPHDVPKIGASNAPYRPPELIFDEMHRKVDFPKPKRQYKRKIAPEQYTPGKYIHRFRKVFVKCVPKKSRLGQIVQKVYE